MNKIKLTDYTVSIYESRTSVIQHRNLSYKDPTLMQYLLENCDKDKRKGFIFGSIIDDTIITIPNPKDPKKSLNRTKLNFSTSPWVVVDIDIKDTNLQDFLTDTKSSNKSDGLKYMFDYFKNDEHCFVCGYSSRGNGLRAFYAIDGQYTFHTELLDENELVIQENLNRLKYDKFLDYIREDFPLIDSYFDMSFKKNHVQMTYSMNSQFPYNYNSLFIPIKPNEIVDVKSTKDGKIILKEYEDIKKNYEHLRTTSNYKEMDWSEMVKYLPICKLRTSLGYNEILPWLSAIEIIDDIVIRKDLYGWLKLQFVGNSYDKYVGSFDNFIREVDNNWRFNCDIELLLRNAGVPIIRNEALEIGQDIFGRKYDEILYYDKYISECNIDFAKHKTILIKADAGGGKTYVALNYLITINGIRIFAVPTNVLADQVMSICKNKYKKQNIKQFYGKIHDKISGDCIVITNFANMSKLEKHLAKYNSVGSCLFIDEVQKIVDYAGFNRVQYIFPESEQTIFLSATPEPFLMGKKDYQYIYCKRNDAVKRDIKLMRFASYKQIRSTMSRFILNNKDKINVIFYNNKDGNQKFIDGFAKYNIHFDKIDSSYKDTAYRNLITNQRIKGNTITTSLVNEGVNILNEDIGSVWIIDNHTQSVFDIYQFLQRFRNAKPDIYYCFVGGKSSDEDYFKDHNMFDAAYEAYKNIAEKDIRQIIKGNLLENTLSLNHIYKSRNKWLINKNQIKQKLYEEWKTNIRNKLPIFQKMLEHYFHVSYASLYKLDKHTRVDENISKEFIITHFDKIIDHKIKGINPLFSITEFMIYEESQSLVRKAVERYKEIIKYNGDVNDFNLFHNSANFNNSLKKLMKDWNYNQTFRGDIDQTIYKSSLILEKILIVGQSVDEIEMSYNLIKDDLLSTHKLQFNDIKKLNQVIKQFDVKFKKTRKNYEKVYKLRPL